MPNGITREPGGAMRRAPSYRDCTFDRLIGGEVRVETRIRELISKAEGGNAGAPAAVLAPIRMMRPAPGCCSHVAHSLAAIRGV